MVIQNTYTNREKDAPRLPFDTFYVLGMIMMMPIIFIPWKQIRCNIVPPIRQSLFTYFFAPFIVSNKSYNNVSGYKIINTMKATWQIEHKVSRIINCIIVLKELLKCLYLEN